MTRFFAVGFVLFLLFFACDKEKDNVNIQYTAKIVGFDLNCATCIVMFPNDSLIIKKELGGSPDNFYQTVNLNQGNFNIGQKLKVKVRKAKDTELMPCIALYPSFNYENVFILEYENSNDLILNDTVDLFYKGCLYDSEKQFTICFDSVINDSRCPTGLECFWAGEAAVRFKLEKKDSRPFFIDLYTGTKDTIFDEYEFSFLQLYPYPSLGNTIEHKDYKARIVINRK
jgi:hypothetical protein